MGLWQLGEGEGKGEGGAGLLAPVEQLDEVLHRSSQEQPYAAPLPVLTVDYLQKNDQRQRGLPRQIKKINKGV